MERTTWTDERLDDMVARTESSFETLRSEIAELRVEMRQGFTSAHEERVDLGRRIDDLQGRMFQGATAIFGSIVAVLAVLLAQG